jgi:hypothetical protein
MQAYQLVELSALVAARSREFLAGRGRLPDARIGQYWSAARTRFDRWARVLQDFTPGPPVNQHQASSAWQAIEPTLEEIFTGEILTRVWSAVACERDRRQGSSSISPVVRSVVLGHMDSRHRALNTMFRAQEAEPHPVGVMNQLRRRSERWTDMLLAHLLPECRVDHVAFDFARCRDFADDLHDEVEHVPDDRAWHLMAFALRAAFRAGSRGRSPNPDLNARIASAVAACFDWDTFDSLGPFGELWMQRLNHVTEDLQAMIEELLLAEQPANFRLG